MERHFVRFYSPGTFVAEATEKPVDCWSVDLAVRMAEEVVERYNARPYGFRFFTRARQDDELDSREVASSAMYYLGGTVETLDEIKARGRKEDSILIANMECNGYDRVVTSNTPWKWTQPLNDGDIVLPSPTAPLTER